MKRLRRFVGNSIVGGVVVLVPLAVLYFVFSWVVNVTVKIIEPLNALLARHVDLPSLVTNVVVVVGIVIVFFLVGTFVKTRGGKFIHEELLEQNILKRIPFYKMVKGVFVQVLDKDGLLRWPVAIVKIWPGIFLTGLVTEDHGTEMCTVLIPIAIHPTTGFALHFSKNRVRVIPGVTTEEGLRTIIACGIGSKELFKRLEEKNKSL